MESKPVAEAPPRAPRTLRRTVIGAALQMVAALVLSTAFAYLLLRFHDVFRHLGPWNYLSVFVAEVGSSATIIIPAPGQAYVFALANTLNPAVVGVIGGVGATLGELTGYFLGTRGQEIVRGGQRFARLRALTQRWSGPILFAFAVLPVPFDIAGVWAGTVRYPLWRFLAYVTPGKIVKVTVIAVAGYYSAPALLRLIG